MKTATMEEPDTRVELQLGNKDPEKTEVKNSTRNPVWDEQFEFLCGDPSTLELSVKVTHVTYLLVLKFDFGILILKLVVLKLIFKFVAILKQVVFSNVGPRTRTKT